MSKLLLGLTLAGLAGMAAAKLPPLSAEAKAKADEAAAKTAWQGKVEAYKLCLAQDRVAARYRAQVPVGRPAPSAAPQLPACADPGAFVYTPAPAKPIEQAGAHSSAAAAVVPPSTTAQTQAEVKTGAAAATAAVGAVPAATAASGVAPAASSVPAAKP